MKIVKEGKWNNPWSAEMTCTNGSCGAVLMVEESDVKATYGASAKFHFTCSVCGSDSNIPSKDLPPRVMGKVEKTRKYAPFSYW
ncbi:MAG: hypothetical protein PHT12_05735 [Patescibacteria group bacterium]|nr:hypothetical protein [Patescibacteria group bacterium]